MNAAPSIDDLLARFPQLCEYTIAPAALAPLPQTPTIERDIRASIAASPNDPRGYAMLANVLTRRSLYLQARDAYVHATVLNPLFAQGHLASAELSSIMRDESAACRHLEHALALRRRYDDPLPAGDRVPVLMLLKDLPYAANAPLEAVLDRERVALHKLYVGKEPNEALPEHAVVFVAFGSGDDDASIVVRARRFAQDERRMINAPELLRRCARATLAQTLGSVDGISPVKSRIVAHDALRTVTLPALVRPAGTHAGRGLAYVSTATELDQHAQRFPSHAYDVSAFVEYASADGYYRKYRIIFVDGVAYPYHLAISPRWIVHYQSSPMEEHAWMRAEEEAFLSEPRAVFARWNEIAHDVHDAIGLDYFGADVTRLHDGTMLVFEADPAMLVHDEDAGGVLAYRRPAVAAIRDALHRLIDVRASLR